jgi:hypothetical protein
MCFVPRTSIFEANTHLEQLLLINLLEEQVFFENIHTNMCQVFMYAGKHVLKAYPGGRWSEPGIF